MADNDKKRFYWIKLQRDFFKRPEIKIIKNQPNGKDFIIFYLELLLESTEKDGCLRFSDTIPYDDNMLAILTDTNITTVRSAMRLFQDLHMIDILDDETIYMTEITKMIGSETAAAVRQRAHREKQKLDHDKNCDNVTIESQNCHREIEIEKEIDYKEKEILPNGSIKKKKSDEQISFPALTPDHKPEKPRIKFIPPTLEEVEAFIKERSLSVDPERFFYYYESNGWKVGGKGSMKNWKAAVLKWDRDNYNKPKVRSETICGSFLDC